MRIPPLEPWHENAEENSGSNLVELFAQSAQLSSRTALPAYQSNCGSTPIRPSRSIVVCSVHAACVSCAGPVENRFYYIDGAGQLCSSRGRQLYPGGI